jgi:pilus assembly protein CpaD
MAMANQQILRVLSLAAGLAALLLAQGCSTQDDTGPVTFSADDNHPIVVAPAYRNLKLSFATAASGLTPEDEARFDAFVHDYLARGNGAVSVSVPEGPESSTSTHYFAERLADLGVSPTSILMSTRALSDGDPRVELGYITYSANTAPCGDWSEDAADTGPNLPMPNFGCSVQHNVAAMVADPRDLVAPRPMGAGDATRRSVVLGKYEAGDPTAATKTSDQSANTTQ